MIDPRDLITALIEEGEEHHETLPGPSVAALVIVCAIIVFALLALWWHS